MAISRRTTIFIDGSTFRDTLRKAYFDKFRRIEETIDFHAVGQFLCAADGQLVLVNHYSGQPVDITDVPDEATGKSKTMIALGLTVSQLLPQGLHRIALQCHRAMCYPNGTGAEQPCIARRQARSSIDVLLP